MHIEGAWKQKMAQLTPTFLRQYEQTTLIIRKLINITRLFFISVIVAQIFLLVRVSVGGSQVSFSLANSLAKQQSGIL